MTHRDHRNEFEFEVQSDSSAPGGFHEVLELLVDHGFDGLAQAMQILINEAMKLERSQVLGAHPYERTTERRGYANGYKPKTLHSRLGTLELAVPQARGVEFYPSALERGTRSERALSLAVAEMRAPREAWSAGCFHAQSDGRDGAALRPGSDEHAGQPGRAGSG